MRVVGAFMTLIIEWFGVE